MAVYEYKCKNKKCMTDTYTKYMSIKNYDKKTHCPECGEIGEKQFGCYIDKLAASKWKI